MHRTAALALAGLVASAAALLGAAPAEAAQTTRLKASISGPAIYYDTDYRNGYQWKRLKPGTSRNFDGNDAIKTSGRSIAIVRGLYRVNCQPNKPNTPRSLPVNEDAGVLQAYPKAGCRNS